jgi:hypothetical protein
MSHYQNADHDHTINIIDRSFVNIAEFMYLEMALNE